MRPTSFGGHIGARGATGAGLGLRRTVRRVSQLFHYTARHKARALTAIAALLGATATTIGGPLVAKQAIDQGITPGDFGQVEFWVAIFVAVAIAGWLFAAVQSYLTTWVGERVLTDLRSDLFTHVQRLDLGYFERTRAGVVISRLTNDIEALNTLVTDGPTTLVQNTITLIGSALVLLYLDWRLALATLVVFPGMAIATGIYRHYSSIAYRRTRERLGEVTASLQEDISGVRVVQAFRREGSNYRQFLAVNGAYREANEQTVTVSAIYFPFVSLLSATAMAVVLGYGGVLVLDGKLTAGALFVFIGLLTNFFDPVQQLSQFYQTFLAGTAALDKIFDVMDTAPAMVDEPQAAPLPAIDRARAVRGRPLRLSRGHRRGAARHLVHGRAGPDGGAGRAHRRRQVDHRQAARPLLRPHRRPHHHRRPRPARRHHALAALAARDRAAGGVPVRRQRPRQHRLRPPRRSDRGRGGGGRGGRRRRVHPGAAGRLRHRDRGARRAALDRPAAAGGVRAGAAGRPAAADPGRGHLVGRHPHRGPHRARAGSAAVAPHLVRGGAPAVDHPQRRPDRGARARPGDRERAPTSS